MNPRFNEFRARKADFNILGNPFNADFERIVRKEL